MSFVRKFMDKFGGAQDMTVGKPSKSILNFAIPMLIGNLANLLYSTVDSIVVGKFEGDGALAAIGATGPMINLLLVLFMGISAGAGIMVSQYFGAKDRKSLSETIGNVIIMNVLTSLVIMAIGLSFARPFMEMLQTPADIIDGAVSYLRIYFGLVLGCTFYYMFSGILRGMGDSVVPLFFLLIATAINIALDLLFVVKFRMGVAGVAYATSISQWVSAVLCFRRILKMKDTLDINRKTLKLRPELISRLIRLGIPSGITQMIFSLSGIVVQSLTNSFGAMFVAVNTVVMRVDGFVMMPAMSFGMAMTTFTGQNVGAKKMDRIHAGVKDGLKISLSVSGVLLAAILIFGRSMMGWFTNTQELIDYSYRMMCLLVPGYIGITVTQILSGTMRGAGDTVNPMWISIVNTVLIRVPLAYLMAYLTRTGEALNTGRPESMFWSMLVSWIMGCVMTLIIYKRGSWKKKLNFVVGE